MALIMYLLATTACVGVSHIHLFFSPLLNHIKTLKLKTILPQMMTVLSAVFCVYFALSSSSQNLQFSTCPPAVSSERPSPIWSPNAHTCPPSPSVIFSLFPARSPSQPCCISVYSPCLCDFCRCFWSLPDPHLTLYRLFCFCLCYQILLLGPISELLPTSWRLSNIPPCGGFSTKAANMVLKI